MSLNERAFPVIITLLVTESKLRELCNMVFDFTDHVEAHNAREMLFERLKNDGEKMHDFLQYIIRVGNANDNTDRIFCESLCSVHDAEIKDMLRTIDCLDLVVE